MAASAPPPFPVPPGAYTDSCAVLQRVLEWLHAHWWQLTSRIALADPVPDHDGSIRHVHIRPEFFIQLGGTTEFRFPDQRILLRHGDMVLLPRLLPHIEFNYDEPDPFCNLAVMPNPGFLGLHICRSEGPGRQGIVPGSSVQIRTPRIEVVNACIDAAIRRRFGPEHVAQPARTSVLLRAMCVALSDILADHLKDRERPRSRIDQCRDMIDLNLGNPELSVADLGVWLDCHPDHLSRLFRRAMGCSVQAYLIGQRVAHARRLLRGSELPVAQVGRACGFADPAYFSRCFRRACGCSPKQFRQILDPEDARLPV